MTISHNIIDWGSAAQRFDDFCDGPLVIIVYHQGIPRDSGTWRPFLPGLSLTFLYSSECNTFINIQGTIQIIRNTFLRHGVIFEIFYYKKFNFQR